MALQFGPFILDLDQRLLSRAGRDVPLTPKAFELLKRLVEQRPRALSKDEILDAVWKDAHVSENNLATTVRDLREALDDNARAPRFIRTAYAYGYAFIGEVVEATPVRAEAREVRWHLIRGDQEMPLPPGEHILGRTGQGVIPIDSPTVSRHHARLTVRDDHVTCEDLGSKNGTWVGTVPATTPLDVPDGSELRLGSVIVIVRCSVPSHSTETVERQTS